MAVVLALAPVLMAARSDPWILLENSAAYRSECSACHIAFPPGLMVADDWLALMADLEHHFGANAALDPKQRKEVSDFLQKNAATSRKYASPEDTPRITTALWFIRKHHGAIRVVEKGRVKSLTDCAACHKGPDIDLMNGE